MFCSGYSKFGNHICLLLCSNTHYFPQLLCSGLCWLCFIVGAGTNKDEAYLIRIKDQVKIPNVQYTNTLWSYIDLTHANEMIISSVWTMGGSSMKHGVAVAIPDFSPDFFSYILYELLIYHSFVVGRVVCELCEWYACPVFNSCCGVLLNKFFISY
jgi:hypothetical protein